MNWDYLAGFIDGEGFLGLVQTNRWDRKGKLYRPTLTIYNSKVEILDAIKEFLGMGNIFERKTQMKAAYARSYHFTIQGHRLEPALLELRPRLILKGPQCEAVLAFIEQAKERKTKKMTQFDINLVETVRVLNARGSVGEQIRQTHKFIGIR